MEITRAFISKKLIVGLVLLFGLFTFAVAGDVHAADLFSGSKGEACEAVGAAKTGPGGNPICDESAGGPLAASQSKLSRIVEAIINILTVVVGVISVIMIIISGIRFVTSNGDSNKITSARNTFIYALVGLIIVAFAQVIVKLVLSRIA